MKSTSSRFSLSGSFRPNKGEFRFVVGSMAYGPVEWGITEHSKGVELAVEPDVRTTLRNPAVVAALTLKVGPG